MESRIWHQEYDPGVATSIDYPDHPIDRFLTKTAQKYPDNTALIFGGMLPLLGERHSTMKYRQLNQLVDRFTAGLQRLGLQKGDRVGLVYAQLSAVCHCLLRCVYGPGASSCRVTLCT